MGAADDALWAQPVFTAGGAVYTWSDVAGHARRVGEWDGLVREVSEGVACVRAGLTPPPGAVEAAARAFRYERRLITAEETEAWLARRGLDVKQWMDHVRRHVLRAHHPEVQAGPADDEVDGLVWATGWCSGWFDRFATAFAEHVAAGLRPLDDVVTPERIHDLVARRRLDWLRVELQQAVFPTEGAAREATLSMRADGLSIGEVCELAGVDHTSRAARIEQLDDALRAEVLGAREGQVVGPVSIGDGFVVAVVNAKTLPSVEDPEVRERAATAIVEAARRQSLEELVHWHDR